MHRHGHQPSWEGFIILLRSYTFMYWRTATLWQPRYAQISSIIWRKKKCMSVIVISVDCVSVWPNPRWRKYIQSPHMNDMIQLLWGSTMKTAVECRHAGTSVAASYPTSNGKLSLMLLLKSSLTNRNLWTPCPLCWIDWIGLLSSKPCRTFYPNMASWHGGMLPSLTLFLWG